MLNQYGAKMSLWRVSDSTQISTPAFLWIKYDRQLTLKINVYAVYRTLRQGANLLHKMTGTSWGWQPTDLHSVYTVTKRSVTEYAALVWTLWISATNTILLE